ncbi:phytase [bacterium]|nr:phytase [bacterium]
MPRYRNGLPSAVPALAPLLAIALLATPASAASVSPRLTLTNAAASDQDDLAVWLHPTDASLSTFIASDKAAGKLFVYDLRGALLQTVGLSGMPGNIDLRYRFPLGSELVDIVVHNDRDNDRLVVHRIDPSTRHLVRIDDGSLSTGANYGLTLYHSPDTGDFHAFTSSKTGNLRQFRLSGAGGVVTASQERSWSVSGITEGCVADDETGSVYFSEENKGIWKIGAEPDAPTSGTLIASVGDASGLVNDVEGITIYYRSGGSGYLIVSSQGNSTYKVYERAEPHSFVTSLSVSGVSNTDGVDVVNLPLGAAFPYGIFACHNDNGSPKAIVVCAYEDLGLSIDASYWDPRTTGASANGPLGWAQVKAQFR